ncbi:uncharacterized protein [Nicotiana tomentosiformis]|uniref:uncharacterized protein n=1 Tax=Nicotiana tomentosiformis TaxID=4098 RepID=UPI00388CBF4C
MPDDEQRQLGRFGRLQLPSFSGAEGEDAYGFLDSWWEAYERHRPVGASPLTCQQFSGLFLEKFVPQSHKEELCRQFEQLHQGDMSVTQYEMSFLEFAHHAIWLVPTERESIGRFIDGVTFQLRLLMTRERVFGATFDEIVDIARQIEMVRSQEWVERETMRPRGQGGFSGVPSGGQSHHGKGRPFRHAHTARPVHRSAPYGHGS